MRTFSLLFLISLSANVFAQVENWGGPLERIENVLGMGFTCNRADRAEVEYIDCQIPSFRITDINDQMNFDQLSEELIFLEATRRNHQFVSCQRKLFDGLKNPETRNTLKKNAYLQFQNIKEALGTSLQDRGSAQETVNVYRPANFSEDRFNTQYNNWRQERLSIAQGNLSEVDTQIKNLISKIPLGNRKEVKDEILNLIKTNPNISEGDFFPKFEQLLQTLDGQVDQSVTFFNGIKSPQADGTYLYTVDDETKLSLIKNGQVDNVYSAFGMEERLSQNFICRARARYERGPMARRSLEIPLYLAGAYGLGRLAVRAGAGAMTTAARAGMIGLDLVEGVQIYNDAMEACFPPEFLSGSLDESCTEETEISSIYQEADIASCVTTATLGVGSVAFVGGVRIWGRMSQRAIARKTPEVLEENVIVVTARRDQVTNRARRQRSERPAESSPAMARSEGELPKVGQNKINLSAGRIRALKFSPRNSEIIAEHISDPQLRKGFTEAFDKMNDPNFVADYLSDLQEETFRVMLASSSTKLKSMARWGKLDKETMLNVLKSRVEGRGAKVVQITQLEGALSEQAFNARIGQGYLIDHGFPEGMAHGTYTHLIQQDMAYDVIVRSSGKSHQEVIEFLGTSDGMKVWNEMFDADPKLRSPHSPEFFRGNIMENNVPLGLTIPDKNPQSSDKSLLPS